MTYNKELSGTLSRYDKTSENAPSWKGKATINGVDYWLSGWDKSGVHGEFISIKYKTVEDAKKEAEQYKSKKPEPVSNFASTLDDDIPF